MPFFSELDDETSTFSCAILGSGSLNPSTAAEPWSSMSSPTVTTIDRRDPARSETGEEEEGEGEEEEELPSSFSAAAATAGRLGIVSTNWSLLNRSD